MPTAVIVLALKATLLLCAAAAAARMLSRAGAAVRHAVWTTGLVAVLALPAVSAIAPAGAVPAPRGLLAPAVSWLDAPARRDEALPSAATHPSGAAPMDGAAPLAARSFGDVLLVIWAVGAILCLLRVARSLAAARTVARRASPVRDGRLLRIAEGLAAEGHAPHGIPLLQCAGLAAPAAVGLLRGSVLLPVGCEGWTDEEARAVLAHELGHVARRDCLTQFLASLANAVYWFHPLAWHAAGQMALERERACDDRVLRAGEPPARYAGLLLHVLRASRCARPPLGVLSMAAPHQVESRIRSILAPGLRRGALSRVERGATLLAGALVLALVAAVGLEAAPVRNAAHRAAPVPAPIDTSRSEPDMRGDAMASPLSERVPLDASLVERARLAGRAALAGPDSVLARLLLAQLGHTPSSPGDLVRERAAWALTRADGTRLTAPLVAMLGAADWRERSYAAWALALSGDARAVPPLVGLLRAPEWRLRSMAAYALAQLDDPRALPEMERAAGDEAWQVRAPAVAYLGRHRDAATLAVIRAHLGDRHVMVRLAAAEALAAGR
jgi:beta-lactamase regulating signal transducer with metallopeptidase domain/HEAT repeat protein